MNDEPLPNSEIILYQTEDGRTRLEVKLENETVWLTQQHMAELFQTTKQNVGPHLKSLFAEGELVQDSVVKESFTTATSRPSKRSAGHDLGDCGGHEWSNAGLTEGRLTHARLGYQIGHGPQLAPGEPAAEHDSFDAVVLVERLREAIWRLRWKLGAVEFTARIANIISHSTRAHIDTPRT